MLDLETKPRFLYVAWSAAARQLRTCRQRFTVYGKKLALTDCA